ncbi:MAG: hypothetical protein JST92_27090, partial [Deltaproteobacteria bacterium]|nr:hypothetical protein [Deltaproteobacteria bacterium]
MSRARQRLKRTAGLLAGAGLFVSAGAEASVRVVQASPRRAWLDAGAADGLAEGQALTFARGTCTLEVVSE